MERLKEEELCLIYNYRSANNYQQYILRNYARVFAVNNKEEEHYQQQTNNQ